MASPADPKVLEAEIQRLSGVYVEGQDPYRWVHEFSRSMLAGVLAKLRQLEPEAEPFVLIMPDGTVRPAVEASVTEAVRQIELRRGLNANLPTDGGPGVPAADCAADREAGPDGGRVPGDQGRDAGDGQTPLE